VITGCLKWTPGKAAVSEKARRTLCSYVETLSETRTKRGNIFNILLGWTS